MDGWFGGTTIFGNIHIYIYICINPGNPKSPADGFNVPMDQTIFPSALWQQYHYHLAKSITRWWLSQPIKEYAEVKLENGWFIIYNGTTLWTNGWMIWGYHYFRMLLQKCWKPEPTQRARTRRVSNHFQATQIRAEEQRKETPSVKPTKPPKKEREGWSFQPSTWR